MAKDPYAILGLARGASEKDIKSAYRKLAKQLHPDYNQDNPKAAEKFNEVTQAYDLLSDKDKRARFDRGEIDADGNPAGFGGGGFGGGGFGGGGGQRGFRPEDFARGGGSAPEGVDLGDIFEGLFGGRAGGGMGGQRPQPKGANRSYRLAVSLPDAALGTPQRLTLADGKPIDVKLPKGVEDGMQIRLTGKGEPGPGGNGDAIITIVLATHSYFRREGDDIRLDLPITLDEAVNGAKVRAPTVDGAVMLTVAAGSSSGRTLRLKGKGFTRKDGTRGDQLVTLEIALPESASDSGTDLAKRLEGWHDKRDLRAHFG